MLLFLAYRSSGTIVIPAIRVHSTPIGGACICVGCISVNRAHAASIHASGVSVRSWSFERNNTRKEETQKINSKTAH